MGTRKPVFVSAQVRGKLPPALAVPTTELSPEACAPCLPLGTARGRSGPHSRPRTPAARGESGKGLGACACHHRGPALLSHPKVTWVRPCLALGAIHSTQGLQSCPGSGASALPLPTLPRQGRGLDTQPWAGSALGWAGRPGTPGLNPEAGKVPAGVWLSTARGDPEEGPQDVVLHSAARVPGAPRGRRTCLGHLHDVGELGEAGDGDDVVVRAAFRPATRDAASRATQVRGPVPVLGWGTPLTSPPPWGAAPAPRSPQQQAQMLLVTDDVVLEREDEVPQRHVHGVVVEVLLGGDGRRGPEGLPSRHTAHPRGGRLA